MIVNYDENIYAGDDFLEIDVMNIEGLPLENAWITVRGEDFYETGYTDLSGKYFLDLDTAEIEHDYEITITSHDKIPYEDEFVVILADVNLAIEQLSFDDNGGDGIPNPGENVVLEFAIGNYGSNDAGSVSAELLSYNDHIVVTSSSAFLGNIESFEIVTNSELAIYIDPAMLIGENNQLALTLTNATESWIVPIFLDIESALLNPTGYVVSDENGVIDPGESADIYINIENLGQIAAESVYGELTCNDYRITVLDDNGSFGNILPGNNGNNSGNMFQISADEDIFPGTQIPVRLHFTNDDG
jgi:hypothetical protein